MSEAKKARKGNTILILTGKFEGQKAIAIEDAANKRQFKARIVNGKDAGTNFLALAGHYMVVGG